MFMRAKVGILIIISLLFLAGTVAANLPDSSTIITSDPWVIANNFDQTVITVTALNATTPPYVIEGAMVMFSIDNPALGSLSPLTVLTGSTGQANCTFKVNKTSGVAKITATIISPDGLAVTRSVLQNIDHDSPYIPHFSHPLSATVATQVPFNVSITDRWGNSIDNRRGPHSISLHVHGPAPDDCSFVGYGHDIPSLTLDPNGNQSVNVILTSTAGPNNILMDEFGSIMDKLEWIDAESTGAPFSMTQAVFPSGSPPQTPADGTSFFTIVYNFYDVYGNPTKEQSIWVNTSIPGEEKKFQSNNLGQVTIKYGPRFTIGEINITATAVANSTVTLTQKVKFTNTGASIISLTANPDTMPSHDVLPSTAVSNIIATVADQSGNAVEGETVTFTMDSPTYDGPYNSSAPILSPSSSVTDVYGQASVQFTPGSFPTLGNPGYNASSTGHCNIVATWNSTSKTVPVTWKNYPYLSVSTSVTPLTVMLNDTIDVTIGLQGDGWALQGPPADIVIITDLAGGIGGAGRLADTKTAEIEFVKNATNRTYISLVSFGRSPTPHPPYASANAIALWNQQKLDGLPHFKAWSGAPMDTCMVDPAHWAPPFHEPNESPDGPSPYFYLNPSSDAKIEMDFTDHAHKNDLITLINGYQDYGGTNYAAGINAAILEFNTHGNPGHSKSIIIMGDGVNMMAPIAPGSLESYWPSDWYPRKSLGWLDESDVGKAAAVDAANRAKAMGITIYGAGFPTEIGGGKYIDTDLMIQMTSPGGYYPGSSTAQLSQTFQTILGIIQNQAGVDTEMTVDFQNINVTGVSVPGNQVYDYVYNATASTKIGWQDGNINVTNQSSDWSADNKLDFNIGTIKVGQQWNATFRLKVKQSGLIDVFGNHSTVSFNGGTETLTLPQTFITVVPNLNITEIGVKTITLKNLVVTEPGEIKTLLPVTWNSSYSGNKTLTERVYYSIDSGPYVLFDTKAVPGYATEPILKEYVDYAQLDVTKLPPGSYQIKVYATASDAADKIIMLNNPVVVGGQGRIFIKLE